MNAEYWAMGKTTKKDKFECFKYLVELMYQNKNQNANHQFDTPFNIVIDESCKYSESPLIEYFMPFIDLNDKVWRRLFTLNLQNYPDLEEKVNNKKKEIETLKSITKEVLQYILPSDIIVYCIHPLF